MNYLKSNLAFLAIIVLVIIVLLLSGFIAFNHWQKKTAQNKVTEKINSYSPKKDDIPVNKFPDQFPKDVPIEQAATVTQNYNATSSDGVFQATRVFETNKSLAENLKTYQVYFASNGYKVLATVDQENYKMILGSKDGEQIQVSMNQNTITKVKTVDISYSTSLVKHSSQSN